MAMTRVTIRARTNVTAEALCKAIAKTKSMTASQVVRNEAGDEVGQHGIPFVVGTSTASTPAPSHSAVHACCRPVVR